MGLARIIDACLDLAWYRRQLGNAKECDHHKSVVQLQCFLLLCDVEPIIALAVDQMPPSVRSSICTYLLLVHCLSATQNDETMTLDAKGKVFSEFPRYLQDPNSFYGKNSCELELMGEAMWHFDLLLSEFQCIESHLQAIILEGVARTAEGLADLLKRFSLRTAAEYNLYCHFHGGLHWIVLMKMVAAAGRLEYPYLANEVHLCNSAGLLLAKTRVIAEFTTVANPNRSPLPREYWEIYCEGELAELLNPDKGIATRFFVNHMILDAMRHIPDIFHLLSRLESPLVFRLLAIPQLEDPTSGQMLALLSQLEMVCSRTRNRSLVLIPWQLSLGVTVELLALALLGAVLSIIVSVR
ncbi:Squalene synthetase [Paramicrosporidium saccamoebae]|uniref:Squalene synthetase n=1 Tax=Paramicrosporidium saccamoebae TaxID=1246581 RepID=A0A2H9TJM4_9FUNG|nr:Squalene synthetase [Paramicrosporidium saccamoebae]